MKIKNSSRSLLSLLIIVSILMGSVAFGFAADTGKIEPTLTLATTTSTFDSGLLDYLLPIFEQDSGTKVKVLSLGTGQAIATAQKGDADVLLVHDRAKEDAFVKNGFGVNRRDVMHNQFLIVGPAFDPAKIKGETSVVDAFKKIAASKGKFISRGDGSGTHSKELTLWKAAGITPGSSWYVETGQGMGDTLMMANEMNAYTLADEATYLALKDKFDLVILYQGEKILLNPYGVMAVNPAKYPDIHYNAAMAFVNFMTSDKGQKLIYQFGRQKYGKSLFIPDAIDPAKLTAAVAAYPALGKTTINLNVRAARDPYAKILGVLKAGTQVRLLGAKLGWYTITYNGQTSYVFWKYIQK